MTNARALVGNAKAAPRASRHAIVEAGRWLRVSASVASGVAVVLSIVVLAGWVLDVDVMKGAIRDLYPTHPITAGALLGLGVATALLAREDAPHARLFAGRVVATVVGVAVLAIGALGAAVGGSPAVELDGVSTFAASMPRAAIVAIALLSAAAALRDVRTPAGRRPGEWLAIVGALWSFVALISHAYSHSYFFRLPSGPALGISVFGALGTLAIGASLLLARPTTGIVAVLTGEAAGARVMRRPILIALLGPPALGLAVALLQQVADYDLPSAWSLLVGSAVAVSVASAVATARRLNRDEAQRKDAEAALRRWENVFMRADWGIAFSDPEGTRLADVNPAFARMHGYAAEELRGRAVVDMYAPEVREKLAEEIARISAAGHHTFESVHLRKDGSRFPVVVDATAVHDDDGQVLYRAVYVQDITTRVEAARAKARLAAIVETSNDAITTSTLEGTMLTWNAAAARIYGYSAEEMIGTPGFRLTPPELEQESRAVIERVRAGDSVTALETQRVRKDGSRVDVSATASPLFDERGEVIGVSWISRDVTARKEAERELARAGETERQLRQQVEALYRDEANAKARLEGIVQQLPDGVIVLDASGHVTMNRAAAALTCGDTGARDPLGNPVVFDVRYPSGQPVPFEELPLVRAAAGELAVGELEIRAADGRRVPVLARAAPIHATDGASIGAVVVFQDVSIFKDLERMREEWTAVVAHDLRQPINAIAILAQGLRRKLKDRLTPDAADTIDRIRGAILRQNAMIEDLLDASRLEAQKLRLARAPVDVGELARQVALRAADVSAQHRIVVEAPPELPHALVDAARVEQVLVNLLSNAHKYGAPGAEIRVEIAHRDGAIEVAVTNRGPGIDAEHLGRLFERFYRTPAAEQAGAKGLGLGLYICRGLVEAHGGRIWAESTAGEWATFRFTLPLAA